MEPYVALSNLQIHLGIIFPFRLNLTFSTSFTTMSSLVLLASAFPVFASFHGDVLFPMTVLFHTSGVSGSSTRFLLLTISLTKPVSIGDFECIFVYIQLLSVLRLPTVITSILLFVKHNSSSFIDRITETHFEISDTPFFHHNCLDIHIIVLERLRAS